MTDLSLPTPVPRASAYAMSVGQDADGKWTAYCVRDDEVIDGPIMATGDTPAQAMALCAEMIAMSEDECLDLVVGTTRDRHCRCEDVTEMLEAAEAQDSPDDVVVSLTNRVGQCCKCGMQGPIHDERDVVMPREHLCVIEDAN